MNKKIYDFNDYRGYLQAYLKSQPMKGHGLRSQWAKVMGCQVAFVSHVLKGRYDLSIEQAESLTRHLALNKEDCDYFILLVQKNKAGTHQLKTYFNNLLNEKIASRDLIKSRIKIEEKLSLEDQAIYYSSWLYSSVHMILTIPQFQKSPEKIAEYFSVSLFKIREVLEFLETRKLIQIDGSSIRVINNYIFINKDSPLFPHQQVFWRQKAIESIYKNKHDEIHFASIFSISESDIKKLREILLKSIEESTEIIKPSKEEKLFSICMDLFEVR